MISRLYRSVSEGRKVTGPLRLDPDVYPSFFIISNVVNLVEGTCVLNLEIKVLNFKIGVYGLVILFCSSVFR